MNSQIKSVCFLKINKSSRIMKDIFAFWCFLVLVEFGSAQFCQPQNGFASITNDCQLENPKTPCCYLNTCVDLQACQYHCDSDQDCLLFSGCCSEEICVDKGICQEPGVIPKSIEIFVAIGSGTLFGLILLLSYLKYFRFHKKSSES